MWTKRRVVGLLSGAALGLLALVGGLVYVLTSADFEQLASGYIIRTIEDRTGAAVTLDRFEADFRQLRFVLEGLVLRGEEDPLGPPMVSIARIDADFAWDGLLRRSLKLSRLSVAQPELFLLIDEQGDTNIPAPNAAAGGNPPEFAVSVDEFQVSQGAVVIDERRIDVDFDLAGFEGDLEYASATGVLSGSVTYDGALLTAGRPPIPYSLSADFDYTRGTLLLETAELGSGDSRLRLQGRIDDVLTDRRIQLAYTGDLSIDFLNYFLPDRDLQGVVGLNGDLEFSTGRFETTARVRSEGVHVLGWEAENLRSNVRYAFPDQILAAEELEADVLGGRAGGSVEVAFVAGSAPRFDLDIAYSGIDLTELRSFYPWGPRHIVMSRSAGTLTGSIERGLDSFDLQGTASLEPISGPSPADALGLPVRGTGTYRARPGSVEVAGFDGRIRSTRILADGLIDREASSLNFRIGSSSLGDLSFLSSLANGSGELDGVLSGRIADPDLDARFTLVRYRYGDWDFDRVEGRALLAPDRIEFSDVRIGLGDSEVRVNGRTDRNFERPEFTVDIVRVTDSEIRRFTDRPVTGVVAGEARIGSIEPLRFEARLESPDLSYDGHALGRIETSMSISPEAWNFSDVRVALAGATLAGDFLYEPLTQGLGGHLALSGYRLENLQWLGVPSGFAGRAREASFQLNGTLGTPRVEGRILFEGLDLYGQTFVEATVAVETEGPRVSVELEGGRRLALTAEIDTRLGSGYPFTGRARFVDFSTDPTSGAFDVTLQATGDASFEGQLLDFGTLNGAARITGLSAQMGDRSLQVSEPFSVDFDPERIRMSRVEFAGGGASLTVEGALHLSGLSASQGYPFDGMIRFEDFGPGALAGFDPEAVTLTGSASFDGRTGDRRALRGRGEVTAMAVRVGDRTLRVSEPFTAEFDADRLRISRARIRGNVTSLAVEGAVAFSGEAPLDFSVEGGIDLSILSASYAGLETLGMINVDARIGGSPTRPEIAGVATLENVSLGYEGLFLSLSSVSGSMFFEGNRVNLTNVRGSAGGGDVALRGGFTVEGVGARDLDVRADLSNVRIRTPQGLRTVVSGGLALEGTPEAPSLEGNLQVVDFSFNEGFDQFLELFGGVGAREEGPLDRLALAIHVDGDRNIRIENEVANVEARLDLDIGGTFGEPALTGHIETTSGILLFQGNRYRITRGSVDFVDPLGIEPLIDAQAETDLRNYRVILTISGRGDDIRLDMRSDPPLSQLEIVSLVAGGRTREELAAGGANAALVPSSEQLFTGGAATILSDLLQERVGSRLGLLGRVRIDPFLVGAENDPVARVTISEQITRNLEITYSQDLSSNRQQIILIEYFLSNDTSLIASRDETGALGVDIRLRKRFQ